MDIDLTIEEKEGNGDISASHKPSPPPPGISPLDSLSSLESAGVNLDPDDATNQSGFEHDVDLPTAAERIRQNLGCIPSLLQQIQQLRSLWQASEADLREVRSDLHEKNSAVHAMAAQHVEAAKALAEVEQNEACLGLCLKLAKVVDVEQMCMVVHERLPEIFKCNTSVLHVCGREPVSGIAKEVEETGERTSGTKTQECFAFDVRADPYDAAFACVPILSRSGSARDGAVLGSLCILDSQRTTGFCASELDKLEAIASHLGECLETAGNVRMLEDLAARSEESLGRIKAVNKMFDPEFFGSFIDAATCKERQVMLEEHLLHALDEENDKPTKGLLVTITNTEVKAVLEDSIHSERIQYALNNLSQWLSKVLLLKEETDGLVELREMTRKLEKDKVQALGLVERLQACCAVLIELAACPASRNIHPGEVIQKAASTVFDRVEFLKVHMPDGEEEGADNLALLCARSDKTVESTNNGTLRMLCSMPQTAGALEACFSSPPRDGLDKWFLESLASGLDAALRNAQLFEEAQNAIVEQDVNSEEEKGRSRVVERTLRCLESILRIEAASLDELLDKASSLLYAGFEPSCMIVSFGDYHKVYGECSDNRALSTFALKSRNVTGSFAMESQNDATTNYAEVAALALECRLRSSLDHSDILSAERIVDETAFRILLANSLYEMADVLPERLSVFRKDPDGNVYTYTKKPVSEDKAHQTGRVHCLVGPLFLNSCLEEDQEEAWIQLIRISAERILNKEALERETKGSSVVDLALLFGQETDTTHQELEGALCRVFNATASACVSTEEIAALAPLDSDIAYGTGSKAECIFVLEEAGETKSFLRLPLESEAKSVRILSVHRKSALNAEEKDLLLRLSKVLLAFRSVQASAKREASAKTSIERRYQIEREQHNVTQLKLLKQEQDALKKQRMLDTWDMLLAKDTPLTFEHSNDTIQQVLVDFYQSESAKIYWNAPPEASRSKLVQFTHGESHVAAAVLAGAKVDPDEDGPTGSVQRVGNLLAACRQKIESQAELAELRESISEERIHREELMKTLLCEVAAIGRRHTLLEAVLEALERGCHAQTVVEEILKDSFPIRRCALVHYDPVDELFWKGTEEMSTRSNSGVIAQALASGEPVIVTDPKDERLSEFDMLHSRMANCLCLPLSSSPAGQSSGKSYILQAELVDASKCISTLIHDLKESLSDLPMILATQTRVQSLDGNSAKLTAQLETEKHSRLKTEAELALTAKTQADTVAHSELAMKLVQSDSVRHFVTTLSEGICEMLDAERCVLALWDHTNRLKILSMTKCEAVVQCSGITGKSAMENRVIVMNNSPRSNPRYDKRIDEEEEHNGELKSFVCVPFFVRPNLTGIIRVSNKQGGFETEDIESIKSVAQAVKIKLNHFGDLERLLAQQKRIDQAAKASLQARIAAHHRSLQDRSGEVKWLEGMLGLLNNHEDRTFPQAVSELTSVLRDLFQAIPILDLNVYVVNMKAGRFVDVCGDHNEQQLNTSNELVAVCGSNPKESVTSRQSERTNTLSIFLRSSLRDSMNLVVLRVVIRRISSAPVYLRRIKLIQPCVSFVLASSLNRRRNKSGRQDMKLGSRMLRLARSIASVDMSEGDYEAKLCTVIEKNVRRALRGSFDARLYLKLNEAAVKYFSYHNGAMVCAEEETDLAECVNRGIREVFDAHTRKKVAGFYLPIASFGYLQVHTSTVTPNGTDVSRAIMDCLKEVCSLLQHTLDRRQKYRTFGWNREKTNQRRGPQSECQAHEANAKLRLQNLFLRAEIHQLQAKYCPQSKRKEQPIDVVDRIADCDDSESDSCWGA